MTRRRDACVAAHPGGSESDVWTLFTRCADGDERAREAIITRFLPYARHLALRFVGRGEPFDDLYQAASIGLIKAVDRFEPTRGHSFVAFARPTILGEIRRHFRDVTWRVHVPRSVKADANRVAVAQQEIRRPAGSAVTSELIAAKIGLAVDDVDEAQRALNASRPTSWEATPTAADGPRLALCETVGAADARYDAVEECAGLKDALASVNLQQRQVLLLRFGGELTQTEIAGRVGCSQMQISRILRGATATVAAAIGAH